MTAPAKISLCMIVRDEADFILDCLQSVREAVDEMVVVDTGSTDATPALARQAGADVHFFEWCDDFAQARNASLAHAQYDWVLILDADERLAPGGAEVIRAAVARDDFDCGLFPIYNAARMDASAEEVLSGRASVNDPCLSARLARRTPDLQYVRAVHEWLAPWDRDSSRVVALRTGIIHLGSVPEVRARRNKSERNLRLLQQRLREEPQDFAACGYLACEHLARGELEEAWRVADAGWTLFQGNLDPRKRLSLALAMARADLQIRRADTTAALDTLATAESLWGAHPDLDVLRAVAHSTRAAQVPTSVERGAELDAAARAYRAALAKARVAYTERYIPGSSGPLAWKGLGTAALWRGDPTAALECFEAALEHDPMDAWGRLGKAQALVQLERAQEAEELTDPLLDGTAAAWLVKASGAERQGCIDDFEVHVRRGYEAAERGGLLVPVVETFESLLCRLSAYRGQPRGGPGTVGAACALLAGERPSRAPDNLDARDRSQVALLVRNLIRLGRHSLVERLLGPEAERYLPGVGEIVSEVAAELASAHHAVSLGERLYGQL